MLEHQEDLQDTGFTGTVSSEKRRQRRETQLTCVFPRFEILSTEFRYHSLYLLFVCLDYTIFLKFKCIDYVYQVKKLVRNQIRSLVSAQSRRGKGSFIALGSAIALPIRSIDLIQLLDSRLRPKVSDIIESSYALLFNQNSIIPARATRLKLILTRPSASLCYSPQASASHRRFHEVSAAGCDGRNSD